MTALRHWLLLAGVAVVLSPLAAQAGRAQVGIGVGTWATTDLDGASASGQSWRDGLPLEQVTDAAALPDKDWATVNLRVDSGARNTSARAEAQAQARLRGNGQAFSGTGAVASDVAAGTLSLQWQSSLAQQPGTPREGFARGYPFAELWETFEVVYPIARVAPIEVTLSLQLAGQLSGTDPADPLRPGVEAVLSLGGVATGDSHDPFNPVWRSEAGTAGTVLSYTGALQSTGCSVVRGVCSGFVSLYAGLDLRGRLAGAPADAWQTARGPLDVAFDGQLALRVSDGVTLVRGDVSDVLPPVAWAQVSSVPEPATALALLAGLGLLALWRRRARLGTLALLLAAGLPGLAHATYQLTATARAHAVSFLPLPGTTDTDPQNLNFLNKPGAATLQRLDTFASTDHGSATGLFLGRIGLLKAYAASSYARCCIEGATVLLGDADASVQASFYDEVYVDGAGLALGTPVNYQLVVRLSGTVSRSDPARDSNLAATALATARLRDTASGQAVDFSWDAARQDTGVYTLTLATAVGRTLAIQGMLDIGTRVSAGALIGRSAEVDFYNTAGFHLAPSVAGLNTIGASGTNFLAPVPEPAAWASLLLGLIALPVLRRVAQRPSLSMETSA